MGKGGSQTTSVQIPAWLENAAKANIARAETTAAIGPTPYYGPDVAALNPMQEAAMANTNRGAAAFGMTPSAGTGMPPPTTFAGGVQGYSSGGLYDQALAELKRRAPGQYAALRAPFIDPVTGALPTGVYAPGYTATPPATQSTQSTGTTQPQGDSDRDRQELKIGGGGGGGGNFRSSGLAARLPGGINTNNPNSMMNRVAAALTSGPQKAPTKDNKPKANPKRK